MSATNRGAERIASDNYPTPGWCVRRLLERAPWGLAGGFHEGCAWLSGPRIIEPCAGEGAIVHQLRMAYPKAFITAWDIRPTCTELRESGATAVAQRVDSLLQGWPRCDLVLTNPPFSLWQAFAKKGIEHGRWCALLLRVGAIAHLNGLPTPSMYVLPQRPAFVQSLKCKGRGHDISVTHSGGCGWRETISIDAAPFIACPTCGGKVQRSSSDASEYAWFVWGPQLPKVVVLADTPLSERKVAA